jgi:hypothetical protein
MSIFLIMFGLVFLIFNKPLARFQLGWQRRFASFEFIASEKLNRVANVIGGAIFVIVGLCALFGLLRFKE